MEQLQEILTSVWNEWTVEELLGEGTFGKVYKIRREFLGREQYAALKVIRISQNKTNNGFSFSADDKSFIDEIISEIELMAKFKGNSNIVSYEDHRVVDEGDIDGWTILIRMELLTPLPSYLENTEVTEETVIKLGKDISNALEILGKNNIIHRDVKIENIFVSENGDFKLGDFGTARIIEKTVDNRTKTGTYMYMAPEVIKSEPYGAQADIYSLGILMYYLLNHNRFPFFPAYPDPVKFEDSKIAFNKRISGESIPALDCQNPKLSSIVLKACEFDCKNRFANAHEMNIALDNTYNAFPTLPDKKQGVVKRLLLIGLVLLIIVACGIGIKKAIDNKKSVIVQAKPTETSSQTEMYLSEDASDIENQIIDILLNGYDFNSMYLYRDSEGGEELYYTFLDVDFDGIAELLVNHDCVSSKMKTCEIYKFDFENNCLDYMSGADIYDNDLNGIMLFGAKKMTGPQNMFYLFEEKTDIFGGIWYKINKVEYVENEVRSTSILDFNIFINENGTYNEIDIESYDSTLKEQKDNLCKSLLNDNNNLNLNYKVINGKEYNDMSSKDKETALRQAYRAFSYDGITTEE